MGYTHYWVIMNAEKNRTIPKEAIDIIKDITTKAYVQRIIQRESNVVNPPVVNEKIVSFNGVGEDSYETFYFDVDFNETGFCKTGRRPYDKIVMMVLIVLGKYVDGLLIRSDGNFNEEWKEVREYMKRKYNIPTYVVTNGKYDILTFKEVESNGSNHLQ